MSRILVVLRSAPGPRAREAVDVCLAALAYEHDVSILLIAAGVLALKAVPASAGSTLPDLPRALEACRHHGLGRLAASQSCLLERALVCDIADVELLAAPAIGLLIEEHAHVLSF
jgi:sulfur relay (sulfurtransferase) DsrF/TusC family protein